MTLACRSEGATLVCISGAVQVLEGSMSAETGMRGASVVAPCPHDGVCPMQGTRSWCHFAQRFERSSLQRVTKLRQGGGLARTYQVFTPSLSFSACGCCTQNDIPAGAGMAGWTCNLKPPRIAPSTPARSGLPRGYAVMTMVPFITENGGCNPTISLHK